MLISLLLIGSTLMTPPMAIEIANHTIVDDGTGSIAHGVNRILGGIISYVRWPAESRPLNICLVGNPHLTDHIAPAVPGRYVIAVRRTTTAGATGGRDCDILFMGRMPIADRQRLIAWVRGKPVITITDDDPGCSYGAMFCLKQKNMSIGFSVNLDAIGRGTLRIDPRVLKIGSVDGDAR